MSVEAIILDFPRVAPVGVSDRLADVKYIYVFPETVCSGDFLICGKVRKIGSNRFLRDKKVGLKPRKLWSVLKKRKIGIQENGKEFEFGGNQLRIADDLRQYFKENPESELRF